MLLVGAIRDLLLLLWELVLGPVGVKRLVLVVRSQGSLAAGAVAALADAAKIAGAITVITGQRDAGLGFLLEQLEAREGCKYFAQFAGSLRAQPARLPIAAELAGLIAGK